MDKEIVKKFAKIDFDDDDDIVDLLMEVAQQYTIGAIGTCNYSDARVRLLTCVIVSELYEKRKFTVDKIGEKAQYTIRSIIRQLQMEQEMNEDA